MPAIVTVLLNWAEIHQGGVAGVMRQISALQNNRATHHEGELMTLPDGFGKHIMGCHGEIAAAKHLGFYWNGTIGQIDQPDVGPLQVRATEHSSGDLKVHNPPPFPGKPGDKPGDIFLSARLRLPNVDLMGWMYGREAQQQKYWRTLPGNAHRPLYLADSDDLHAMAELFDEMLKSAVARLRV